MAATGFTPVSLYYSATASNVPLAANLVAGELAMNTNDGKLFYKDSSGVVQTMASKATGSIGGSTTQVQFNNAGALGGSASLTWSGTVLTSSGFAGPLNGTVGATTPAAGSFTTTTIGTSETLSYGTANGVTYLNGSKVVTSGSALTFDGSQLVVDSLGTQLKLTRTSVGSGTLNIGGSGELAYAAALHIFYDATRSTEWMRLTSTGLGIGTSSPGAKLAITAAGDGTFNSQLVVAPASGANPAKITFNPTVSSAIAGLSDGSVAFFGNGANTERMRIDSSGNLGLGVTPSAIYSAYKGIQLFDATSMGMYGSGYGASVTTNAYPSAGGSVYTRGGNSYRPTKYNAFDGAHMWSNAAAAGTTITWTDAMTLDASGNLGIGTTTIGSKLYVVGDTNDQLLRVGNSNATGTQYISIYANGAQAYYNSVNTQNSDYGQHVWYSQNNAGTAERMRIDYSGRLLVATTSNTGANTKLVVGSGLTSTNAIGVFNTSDANVASIFLSNWTGSTTTNKVTVQFDSSGRGGFSIGMPGATNAFYIYDEAAATERMRIDSSGNLLVGTTSGPSVNSTLGKIIKIAGVNIEATNNITVGTSFTDISKDINTGSLLYVSGYQTSTGGQAVWVLLAQGSTVTVIATINATGITASFQIAANKVQMKASSTSWTIVCANFTANL